MINGRYSGVLMHISSMPGKYGVGVMGKDTEKFIDVLSECEFRFWQLLPVNVAGEGNSPYSSYSAFAGDYIYIDPEYLYRLGLVSETDIADNIYKGSEYTANYDFAREKRLELLKKAYNAAPNSLLDKVKRFNKENVWLNAFALYMAVKDSEGGKPWWEWQPEHIRYADVAVSKDLKKEVDFWKFTQYIFFANWSCIADYAHKKDVKIIGDMPIYVAMDSADVWSNPEMFQIDPDTLKARTVAGVPPDYFSADGQLWGNPLYDWGAMKNDGYKWWVCRLKNAMTLYDTVRIDHFRAFARYWSVPAEAETAKEGEWVKGPGKEFFSCVLQKVENASIIAEDLGEYDKSVVELLKDTGFPGMRIVQFGFSDGDSTHMPHNYPENCVAYIGTHDNNTLLGWLWECEPETRKEALDYCGFDGDDWGRGGYNAPACRKIIETVWKSHAYLAMISFQDLCGFGCDARINIPGKSKNNWRYRASLPQISEFDKEYYKKINRLFRRTYPH